MQRALFARLIVQDQPVILLDEPFGAIDAATIDDLLALIARWRAEGRTVVAVLHELDIVRRAFPRTLLLARECIFWGDTRDALCAEESHPRARRCRKPSTSARANVFAMSLTPKIACMFTDVFVTPFADYEFMRRALVGSLALALSGAPLGVFLILRRMSLAGDALVPCDPAWGRRRLSRRRSVFAGDDLRRPLRRPRRRARRRRHLPIHDATRGRVARGLLSRLAGAGRDARIACAAPTSTCSTCSSALSSDLMMRRFCCLSASSFFTLVLLAVFYRALVLDTLDPLFLRQTSAFGEFTPFLFLALVVLNLVAGFHALGTLMAVGVMMLPAAAARLWTRDLAVALPLAAAIGALLLLRRSRLLQRDKRADRTRHHSRRGRRLFFLDDFWPRRRRAAIETATPAS